MKYLLDSNIVSDFYEPERNGAIVSRLETLHPDDRVYISILSLYEFEYRFSNAPQTMQAIIRAQIAAMREDFEVLPLSDAGAEIFGSLKQKLYATRSMKPDNLKKHTVDSMIAANVI